MKQYDKIIEGIQKAQVDAGGRFLKRSEIEKINVGELIKLLIPNNVSFEVKHQGRGEKEVLFIGQATCFNDSVADSKIGYGTRLRLDSLSPYQVHQEPGIESKCILSNGIVTFHIDKDCVKIV